MKLSKDFYRFTGRYRHRLRSGNILGLCTPGLAWLFPDVSLRRDLRITLSDTRQTKADKGVWLRTNGDRVYWGHRANSPSRLLTPGIECYLIKMLRPNRWARNYKKYYVSAEAISIW